MSNHHKVYESLVQTLQQGTTYYATAYEAMKTVEVIERIYQSAKKGPHGLSTKTG
jgi:hypothetical protein